ncbi:MAG: aminotransferase class III-fold pyridoxal phosphate-dependent enzyme [Armatimonadetes bacterium]|nr:aminotransferase class III-fold pyridoxal phosphate-dependent enzyme [Armatimonadota bacterium]
MSYQSDVSDRQTVADQLSDEVIEKYRLYVNPGIAAVHAFSGFAVPGSHARGCYIWDASGRKFLDCVGGYGAFSLGHLHPKVVDAVKKQLEKEALKSQYLLCAELAEACELLASVLPGEIRYSFLCNSGAEAVEGALKAARIHTGRPEFIGAVNGFHGKTFGSLSVSGREIYKTPFYPLLPETKHVPFGDANALANAISNRTAAVILEVVQGEGGVIIAPDDYLPKVREICDDAGALLILDEVRTCLGRTGKMFASEHYEVVPDIVTMAKALGGGVMPVGAFSSTEEVWQSLFGANPYLHSTTFGGNPLACVAVTAAIKTTIEEGLVERSARLGEILLEGLKAVQSTHPDMIKDVRGKGLLAGVEFAEDDIALLVIAGCGKRDVLMAYSMNNPRVIRIEPPLIIEESELTRALEVLAESIEETAEMVARIADG